MAIQQVTATINVAVQGINQLQQLNALYQQTGTAAQNAQNRVNQAGQAMGNSARQATAFTGSIAKLTQSMVLFSVLLPVVRLPQTAIRSFQEMVDVGTEWEHQIRSINSLLGLQGDQYTQLDNQMKSLANTYGLTTNEVGTANKAIASTLGVIQRNTAGMTAAQQQQDDYNTSLALMDKIAKLSRASFEDMNSVTEAAFTILAAGHLTLDQADAAFNELFKTVQIGRTTFSQFNQDAGKFLPLAEEWIDTATTADDRFKRLTGTLDEFAAASNALGSARAATGLGRVFQAMAGTSAQQQQLIKTAESFRKRKGLGEEYDITPQALFALSDPAEQMTRLQNVLGPQSPLIDQYINQQRSRGTLKDEAGARATAAQQLQKRYFEQVQAIRAFEQLTPENIRSAAQQRANAPGEQAGYEEYLKDPAGAVQRLSTAWTTLQATVFQSMQADIIKMNVGFAKLFDTINKNLTDNKTTGFFETLGSIFKQVTAAFNQWYASGGKQAIADMGYTLGKDITQALDAFLRGDDAANAFMDAGKTFAQHFVEGVAQQLPQLLMDALQSSLVRAIASFVLLRRLGAPMGASVAGGAATSMLPSGGAIGAVTSLLPLLGILGTTALGGKAMGGLGGLLQRIPGVAPGGIIPPTPAGVGRIPKGQPGAGRFVRTPATPGNQIPNIGGLLGGRGGRIGSNALLSALMAAPGIIGAITGPDEGRGEALGSNIGMVGGSVLGGLLGSLVAPGVGTVAGSLIGGAAGNWLGGMAGGWIQNQFFKPQAAAGGAAAAAGSGLGPGTEAADDLTMVFIMGLNNSTVARDLEQMNRKMDIPGRVSNTVTTKTPGTGGAAATGAGPGLVASETSQFDPSTLTKAQAYAACGPAAVDFFVKAYGRTPTLEEAYALQSKLQGGDIANMGGSNIAQMGQAIQQLGAPAGEVYQGSNIDWGRLAEGAKAGIPGIVNIGPSGKFPGHFFQISGWDPATNKFRVGKSGTALMGGSDQMTPEQMMALGPAMGAIYGTTAPAARTAGGDIDSSSRAAFVNSMMPYAQDTAAKLGVDPKWLIAMAASESNWGNAPGNSFFGIKGQGTAGQVSLNTWELVNGQRVNTKANFAAYNNPAEAFDAYAQLLQGHYPGALNQKTLGGFVGGLKSGGYMTDTAAHYTETLQGLVSQVQQLTSGTGTGPGGIGGVVVNGPLIGSVTLSGSATQDDADQLAAMIADALEGLMNTGGGGTVGQNKIFKS